ncbi:hypothetical protein [Amycolatopsis sp. PS_44_ISF1]|uniref:hypothetical protein n=1 Tax=Amycolatopsis sp. PS_44_ISF1 TaxID=2974917 RepID=UPI0028DFA8B6|nr:hypothetical protein [Amycolatopsis sp. PS_44_ISF1]MDT8913731.1 hypothetical protein [Amycolatopsis sp. PS_44_ISF1]MDT8916208.1 hypothetical protein [Amycolatopsis sp. PS_44_ISF1]
MAVLCGTQFGPVEVTLRLHHQPPAVDTVRWDMSVERTLQSPAGELIVTSIYSGDPQTLTVPAGHLRLRVSVRNRAGASTLTTPPDATVEHHHIDLWPVETDQPPQVVHGPDELAQHLR